MTPGNESILLTRSIVACGRRIPNSDGYSNMARMIPAQPADDVVSSAERRIFHLLDTDPDTKGWIVLHSLGLARRPTGPYGEIDFVVLIPHEGILCLEIKGGRVSCENGVWRTMDRYGKTAKLRKSPFMQARESMFALRARIIDHFGRKDPQLQCPIAFAVVFPDVVCPPATPEFDPIDVIDTHDLRRPLSASLNRIARNRLRAFQPQSGDRQPTPSQLKSVLAYLRPDFDLIVARSATLAKTEAALMSLTQEQYDRLDELEENPRCLFEGPAGTGKTLLALEYARRASNAGKNVLLVCYNRLLGDWLKLQTEGTGITAGTWHETLKDMIAKSSVGEEFSEHELEAWNRGEYKRLFNELYPFYGELALEELGTPFDVLVMDEAQDLWGQATFNIMTRTIKGGMAGGTWAIFGDLTRQALYDNSSGSVQELSEYSDHFVRAKLTLNCRNTRKIAEEAAIIGGFDTPPYKLGSEAGMPVEHRFWRKPDGLVRTLQKTIGRLISDGVSVDDVMILSPRRLENSALADVDQICDMPLFDCSRSLDPPQKCIRFSTIYSFKGLESQVVIMVDIEEVDDDKSQSLLYVGMSRARSLLVLLIHESARSSIDSRIRAASAKGNQT